jgi:putative transposase
MPRKARIDAPGALHHVICRGIDRTDIFRDNVDRDNFAERLGNLLCETSTSCFAWALLPNHFHLLLRTGSVPITTVMRRLLTGYAVTFNRRYRRHGHLFQNRYKSILCEEEPYLLELVRYIHLNPLRAGFLRTLPELGAYPYTGHSALMGQQDLEWQDAAYVLKRFGDELRVARDQYRSFVKDGVKRGRRPELVGGGLIRSLGGWSKVVSLGKHRPTMMADERILGGSAFVEAVLEADEEKLDRESRLREAGYDVAKVAQRAAGVFGLTVQEIFAGGKERQRARARSLFCYWATKELGVSATSLARQLGVSQPAVSKAIRRGEALARDGGLELAEG